MRKRAILTSSVVRATTATIVEKESKRGRGAQRTTSCFSFSATISLCHLAASLNLSTSALTSTNWSLSTRARSSDWCNCSLRVSKRCECCDWSLYASESSERARASSDSRRVIRAVRTAVWTAGLQGRGTHCRQYMRESGAAPPSRCQGDSTQLVLPAAAKTSSILILIRRRRRPAGPAGGVHKSEVALAELVGVVSEPRVVADERFKRAFADIAGDQRTPDRFLPPRSHPVHCMDLGRERG